MQDTIVRHMAICHNKAVAAHNGLALAGSASVDSCTLANTGVVANEDISLLAFELQVLRNRPHHCEPVSYCGINSVGLNRRGFTREQIASIQDTYRTLYMSGLNVSQAVEQILETVPQTPERDTIIDFIKGSPRGIVRGIN